MQDSFGRSIDYMRVSITDRCNLRCAYCMPREFVFIAHDEVMRYEEILRVCAAGARLGIRTIKVTGGEPLSRKGCIGFIRELKAIPGIHHVTLTTNGVLLAPHVETLAALRLDGVNISLDTLDPATYLRITGRDVFRQVWQSFLEALNAGLRVKINCVPIRGVNDQEVLSIARLAETYPADVRFIELMHTKGGEYTGDGERAGEKACLQGVAGAEVMALLRQAYADLTPDPSRHGFGPARYFQSGRLKGSIGFISAASNHFCSGCNRLRLTSEGFLKSCLFHDDGLTIRGMLRSGAGDIEIEEAISRAVYHKPEGHSLVGNSGPEEGITMMSRIGG